MIILNYPTKKELKETIGHSLKYTETSFFGSEYKSNGSFSGCNRPQLTGYSHEFFAEVTMKNDLIAKVK